MPEILLIMLFIAALVITILPIILFFKIWGMTNRVKEMNNTLWEITKVLTKINERQKPPNDNLSNDSVSEPQLINQVDVEKPIHPFTYNAEIPQINNNGSDAVFWWVFGIIGIIIIVIIILSQMQIF